MPLQWILELLPRDELKELSTSHDLDDGGREKALLIARILGEEAPAAFHDNSWCGHR